MLDKRCPNNQYKSHDFAEMFDGRFECQSCGIIITEHEYSEIIK